jgi:hypothetical protein
MARRVPLLISAMIVCFFFALGTSSAAPRSLTVTSALTATTAYDEGFARNLMRAPGGGGIVLEDDDLIEDDSPGAGTSEKGCSVEELYRGVQARKTFRLEDPRAFDAHLVLYMVPKNSVRKKQAPFTLLFNGTKIETPPLPLHEEGVWHWVNIPVTLLRKGENTAIVGCDAPKGQGYDLLMARADEYEKGGGLAPSGENASLFNPGELDLVRDESSGRTLLVSIGKNSAKSTDGGKTWVRMKLGATNDVVGEYTMRLNLHRYRTEGRLTSPCIDLWEGLPGADPIKPRCAVSGLSLTFEGETPPGTSILWQVRASDSPDLLSAEWGEFTTAGSGERVEVNRDGSEKRYLQWRALLSTQDKLNTPVVRNVKVVRTLAYDEKDKRLYVTRSENVRQHYSSFEFSYEKWDEPKLKVLRARLGLDSLLADADGDWEKINRVRHHVSKQWYHQVPYPNYPAWDALEILDRRDKLGVGGMCVQFSQVFIQSLLSLGYQARFVMAFCHEIAEVYVDELGKWVLVDPESVFDAYEYDTGTGMPVNCLEQHHWFLSEYGFSADHPIEWMTPKPWAYYDGAIAPGPRPPLDFSTFTGWINDPGKPDYPPLHRLSGLIRIRLRNNWFSQPYPRPVNQGMEYWPWNGFLNWYDPATPRLLQYSLHSDRESDFYPTMNRVEYGLTHTEHEDEAEVRMITFTPNFDRFEISIDGSEWTESPPQFTWKFRKSALNTLSMRTRNKFGLAGKPSFVEIMYHYKEPYSPKK